MLQCNRFSEQALVINGGEGEANYKNRSKLTEQMSTKVAHSSKGVKPPVCAATNEIMERKEEDFGSLKQQKVPLLGRRFNDTSVSIPIKKRRLQMIEIIRSPSPPPSDNSIDIAKVRETAQGNCAAAGLRLNLYIDKSTESVSSENEDTANVKLLDKSSVPKKEKHAPCLELVVSRFMDGNFAELSASRIYSSDTCAQKADDRGVPLESSGGVPQKGKLPMNDRCDKAGILSSVAIEKSLQIEECQLTSSDDREASPKSSWCTLDDRLHWDLNRDMYAWEQVSNEKPCADNLLNNIDDISHSVDSSLHQSSSGKAKSENTVDEAISKNAINVACDGWSEVNEMEPAHVAESFKHDVYDEEDEPISDTDKHPLACIDDDQYGNKHQMSELVGDDEEELGVEEHVDYGDSDCREAEDMGLEGDEKLSVTLQAESHWKFEEVNRTTELLSGHKCSNREDDANSRKPYHHVLKEQYEMMEEDDELLFQIDGDVDECPGKVLQKMREYEGEKVLQLGEPNICCKDLLDKSELQHMGLSRAKSTGWDQLPEGFHTVEDALKAVKENTTCHRATVIWTASRPGSTFISSQGLSNDGQHGSGALRGVSSRVDGSLGVGNRPYELVHVRENNPRHRRLEGFFDPAPRFLSSREAAHGRTFGRGSGAGRFRVDPWMDFPGVQWRPGHRHSPNHYTGSCPSSRGLASVAALTATKVRSSRFIAMPDGTIINSGSTRSMGRSGMHTSGMNCSHTMPIKGLSIDCDADLDFQTRISMPLHRSTIPRSKLVRQSPSPPHRNEEERSSDRQCKRLMLHAYTPLRRSSPGVAHGTTALIDDRGRQSIDVNQQISPTRLKQSELTGKHPLRFLGKHIDYVDNRRFKRDHYGIGRFSGSYRSCNQRVSLKSVCYRDGDDMPAFDSQREESREDDRREKIVSRDVGQISGFRYSNTRDFDDDVAPRRRRAS